MWDSVSKRFFAHHVGKSMMHATLYPRSTNVLAKDTIVPFVSCTAIHAELRHFISTFLLADNDRRVVRARFQERAGAHEHAVTPFFKLLDYRRRR